MIELAPLLLLVRLKEAKLSLLVDELYVSENLPLATVKFLPEATVVVPFKDTAPVPVANVPVEED